ncbi:Thiol-disulfide oxidoreductase ResA [Symmachiella macrocystis]|uniref:Thiol-disulfide oxidoreductase ResA n=1 Tax=Symmachiella macrocystis TaxID=2527985 RepID=A0A5C6BK31_9PLAN|nr:redoxin domain-containing protein [Symmachiella macrocystis]TWU12438.1 Thiol-disulfide oxidoreductase ResA [Symmachiella macrocystis]
MRLASNCLRFATIAVVLTLTSSAFSAETQPAKSPIGQVIPDFTLSDFRGKEQSLSEIGKDKVVVVAFLGTECPLAKLYAPRLVALNKKFADQGVAFIAVNANSQDSITEMAAYARLHKIDFPMLKDAGNKVADQMSAVRTPEVFVLDKDRTVRYWGRVDDQYGVGYQRDQPQRNDLELALQELLSGKPVSTPVTAAVGCHIGRVKQPNENSEVTYSNQIARILQNRCVECHREGDIAPFALTDYDEVVGWSEMIAEVVDEQRMPPWHANPKHGEFKNDRALTKEEKEQIFTWVKNGAPEGDKTQLPPAREFVSGWELPREPDLVVNMREEPYRVPATGTVEYKYFSVDPGFKEDKWVTAFQAAPGNRAVVHHILIMTREPGQRRVGMGGGALGFLAAYVPGLRAEPFPEGMAKKIPAGSEIVFQMHYTPIGTEQIDLSSLGMIFADPEAVTHEVRTHSAVTNEFLIPPGASNHKVEADTSKSSFASQLLNMMPHMHLRGKSFRYEVRYPDGKTETLLDVPHYDFNWQTSYRLVNHKELPAGTTIHCVGAFDNSKQNLNNPDPTQSVAWGDQTWNEMFIGYFDVAFPVESGKEMPFPPPRRNRGPTPESIMARLDANQDEKIEVSEVPLLLRGRFKKIDTDDDNLITIEELREAFKRGRRDKDDE